jgi:8-amino-7-oxononanoate synthase
VAANLAGVRLARDASELRRRIFANITVFRDAIERKTGKAMPGSSQIVPVITGANERAVELEHLLLENGFFARAIRPPTVPPGSARIRFSITAMHSREQLLKAAGIVADFIS